MAKVLVTGGAGFIGANASYRLLKEGHEVIVYDNLTRSGASSNIEWLKSAGGKFTLIKADITEADKLKDAAKGVERIYHLAGQVAVTTSVKEPRKDFEDNALGTFNALEAARAAGTNPIFIFSSTNKVYGGMEDVAVVEEATRYRYANLPYGVAEDQQLDFHSPYGCSKGAADQYVRDYARMYGVRSVVFRQSCIYGYRQFGIEDQGWVAWFMIAALKNRPISIYGDGKQVRDALFIDDLLDGYDAAVKNIDKVAGQVFNMGGGPDSTMSIWLEFGPILEKLIGRKIPVSTSTVRPGDQPIFVADIRKAKAELGWAPKIGVAEGTKRLFEWIRDHQHLFAHL